AAGRPHDAGTRRTEGDRQAVRDPAPRPPLPGLLGNAVAAVPEGRPAARQTSLVCLSGAANRHPPDADGRGPGEPETPAPGIQTAVPSRTDRAESQGH